MRIVRNLATPERALELDADLVRAMERRGVEGRICGDRCSDACRRCGSKSCQCSCSPYCPDAPRALSSDPMFPLEPRVAPLVFAMKRTGLLEPCWSCEGHAGPDGVLTKPPAVWFYCEATTHLRLLYAGIAKLRLNAPWRIAITYSDPNNPEPTFALEPLLGAPAPTLAQLQADIGAIAQALPDLMRNEASALRHETRAR